MSNLKKIQWLGDGKFLQIDDPKTNSMLQVWKYKSGVYAFVLFWFGAKLTSDILYYSPWTESELETTLRWFEPDARKWKRCIGKTTTSAPANGRNLTP